MSNVMYFDSVPVLAGTISRPVVRGRFAVGNLVALSRQSLPTDPIGTHVLTLDNVVIGSRINIRDLAGTTTLYDQIATSSDVVISLSVYAAGSGLNNWRIKVRKASGSPNYIPYETLMTATTGSSSIYVSQIPDE